jgi:hypothetical protein
MITIGIIALLLLQYPLGCMAGRVMKRVSRDYASHNNPFGRDLP